MGIKTAQGTTTKKPAQISGSAGRGQPATQTSTATNSVIKKG